MQKNRLHDIDNVKTLRANVGGQVKQQNKQFSKEIQVNSDHVWTSPPLSPFAQDDCDSLCMILAEVIQIPDSNSDSNHGSRIMGNGTGDGTRPKPISTTVNYVRLRQDESAQAILVILVHKLWSLFCFY